MPLCTTDVIAIFAMREIYPQNISLCHDCYKLTWWPQDEVPAVKLQSVIHPLLKLNREEEVLARLPTQNVVKSYSQWTMAMSIDSFVRKLCFYWL